jgi:hypothetical protein
MKKSLNRCSSGVSLALLTTLLTWASAVCGATTVYSLNGDWSDVQNPSVPWSYNYNNSPIGTHQTFFWGQAGWGDISFADGAILRGSSPAGATDPWGGIVPPSHDWQPQDVMLHALSIPYGGGSTFLNVKWTSPADGFIDISGRAWDGQIFDDRDVRWALSVGGETFAQRSSVRGLFRNDSGAQFQSNLAGAHTLTGIPISQGEVVEFLVAAQTYYGHFVGLDETITFSTVPEPGTAALLGVGLLATRWMRRRKA